MSDAIIEAKTSGMAAKNNALRDAFDPDGKVYYLLRRAGETSRFTVVTELLGGHDLKWNEYRGQTRLRIATMAPEMNDLVAITSHFAAGVPDAEGKIEVFVVSDDQVDRVAPDGKSVYWKLYGTKVPSERFTIPTPPPDEEEEEAP